MFRKLKDQYFILSSIVFLMFFLVLINLIKLQIVDYDVYSKKTQSYLSSTEIIPASRGKILDR